MCIDLLQKSKLAFPQGHFPTKNSSLQIALPLQAHLHLHIPAKVPDRYKSFLKIFWEMCPLIASSAMYKETGRSERKQR